MEATSGHGHGPWALAGGHGRLLEESLLEEGLLDEGLLEEGLLEGGLLAEGLLAEGLLAETGKGYKGYKKGYKDYREGYTGYRKGYKGYRKGYKGYRERPGLFFRFAEATPRGRGTCPIALACEGGSTF